MFCIGSVLSRFTPVSVSLDETVSYLICFTTVSSQSRLDAASTASLLLYLCPRTPVSMLYALLIPVFKELD